MKIVEFFRKSFSKFCKKKIENEDQIEAIRNKEIENTMYKFLEQ
jgi:hypothetical protein